MNHVFLRLVLLGVVGSAVAPVRVSAQPASAPTVDKKQAARKYTEAGLTAAKLGDYDTAIKLYEKAYALVPHPTLAFDMAEAHLLAGRIDQALTLYKRYLSDAPNGPLAQDARDRIAEIEASKAEEARKAEEDRKAAERKAADERKAAEARKAEEARRVEEARKAAEAARVARERPAAAAGSRSGAPGATPPRDTGSPEIASPPGRSQRIAGIAIGAGGVIGVAIGIGFGLHARSLSSDLSKPRAMYDPSKIDAGHRANTIAIVGMAGGTALAAAGAALYWWGNTHGRSTEQVSLAPILSDQLAGLVVAGTWR
jgi:tetratricopeptide (TPR) repeat protein